MTGVLRMVFILSAKNKTIQPPTGRNIVKNRKRYILLCAACVAAGARPPQYYHLFFIKTWWTFSSIKFLQDSVGMETARKADCTFLLWTDGFGGQNVFLYICNCRYYRPFPLRSSYGLWSVSIHLTSFPGPSSRPQGSAPRRTNTKKWFFGTSLWHF